MGKIIFVRHGDVRRKENRPDFDIDKLTTTARTFAQKYPDRLDAQGFHVDLCLYEDRKRGGSPVRRCHDTIRAFEGQTQTECRAINVCELASQALSNCDKDILFCYMSEHIYKWPKIYGDHFICWYAGSAKACEMLQCHKDRLYRYMLVCENDGRAFFFKTEVETGTKRGDDSKGY